MINNFIKHIENKNKNYIIFDIGSRDCMQSIEFYNAFPNSQIYAFECNPNTLDLCKKNIEHYKDRITLIEGAVCDYDGEITFYPINQEKTITTWKDGNPGASSIFKSNGKYTVEKYVQDEIKINCHRLDTVMKTYNIEKVDIIWMDLQGAELLALKGLGNYIDDVRYIHTEVSYKEMYSGQVMFNELNNYLSNNFSVLNKLSLMGWQEDVIYERKTENFKLNDYSTSNIKLDNKVISYENLHNYEEKIFSQNGEDGITLEIIKKLDITNGYYVEFGTQDAKECNTRILREKYNWSGLLMDGSNQNDSINLKKEFITRENIVDLFIKYNVPTHFNLLSIDIDYNDFYVLHKILEKYTMDIIILEYNAYFLPNEDAIIKYGPYGRWDGSNYFGASLLSFQKLLNLFGYSLIYTENKGVNAFFVSNKYADKFNNHDEINILYNAAKYSTGPRGGHLQDIKNRTYVKFNDVVNAFDIVIPVGPNDISILNKQIEFTKKNIIGYRNIYLVSYDPSINIEGCITINENIYPFTIETIYKHHGILNRNKWYLQQLLKLYAGNIIPNILDKYLVIDCDTFFLKPTIFVNDNKCLYNFGNEYYEPYFEHMLKLDKDLIKVDKNKSGICHHMIFETKYLNEIFNKVEKTHNDKFYNVFLKLVLEKNRNISGASEYEIYFNYMLKNHSGKITIRELKWLNANNLIENKDLDYISIHWYDRKKI
jgi:FkbM family methyltransferase